MTEKSWYKEYQNITTAFSFILHSGRLCQDEAGYLFLITGCQKLIEEDDEHKLHTF